MTCSRGCCATQQEHFRSVSIAPSATPSRAPRAVEVNTRERGWDRDMPAYKRLRKNGLQPNAIDGCAELETRATTQQEIEMGRLFTKEQMPAVKQGIEMAREIRESLDA